jgi:catechol 2,3-dioxygenase-like lactoylglutathione lyase family enzyme
MFHVEGIDHVALAVRDVAASARWYGEVLGLERRYAEVWGDFPAVVCAGATCLALFPVGTDTPQPPPPRGTLAMRHLAFRVDRDNFARAQAALRARGIAFTAQDHAAALSVYFTDPDGHQLEITTYEHGGGPDAAWGWPPGT